MNTKEYTISEDFLGNVFAMGDFHFDHQNIIKYCNRKFYNFDEMNQYMLNKYNSVVKPDSTFIFMGDMTFGRDSRGAKYWLDKLAGTIIYLKGSHDHGITPQTKNLKCLFLCDQLIVHTPKMNLLFIHEPERVKDWDGWVIHGHHHNNYPKEFPFFNYQMKRMNLSAELLDYTPISILDILSNIDKNRFNLYDNIKKQA